MAVAEIQTINPLPVVTTLRGEEPRRLWQAYLATTGDASGGGLQQDLSLPRVRDLGFELIDIHFHSDGGAVGVTFSATGHYIITPGGAWTSMVYNFTLDANGHLSVTQTADLIRSLPLLWANAGLLAAGQPSIQALYTNVDTVTQFFMATFLETPQSTRVRRAPSQDILSSRARGLSSSPALRL